MTSLRHMQAFTAVVQAGSFVQAAQRLDSSKAVLSRLLQELEASLGTRLLNRTTRRLSLTDTGADYYERCRQILADVDEANAAASQGAQRVAGRLKVNAPLSFGNLHLAPLWGEFLTLHPQVELDITLTDRAVDLVEEGFDLAVRISRHPGSTLVARALTQTRMVLCAAPLYLQRAASIQTLQDLAQHRILAYAWWSGGDTWTLHDAQDRAHSVQLQPCLRANSGDTCRVAALGSQGVIFQPDFLVAEDLRQGRLRQLLPDLRGPAIPIQAVYPSRKHVPGRVRALLDFLVAAFQTPAW